VQELDIVCDIPHCVPISAHHKWNYDSLLEKLWEYLKLVRIYTKPKGQLPGKKGFACFSELLNMLLTAKVAVNSAFLILTFIIS
jgi:hypothetical protein